MKNLRELNIRGALVAGEISLAEAGCERLSDVLSGYQKGWPRRSIDKLGLYEVNGVRHHISLEVEPRRKKNPDSARFTLESHTFPSSATLRSATRIKGERQFSEIQAMLSEFKECALSRPLHSHIVWMFPPDVKRPIIGLPMMTIQGPNAPFAEITGVRLRKEGDAGSTVVTMDLGPDRSLAVSLRFSLSEARISEQLMDYTVQRGVRIIGDFVLDAETQEKGT